MILRIVAGESLKPIVFDKVRDPTGSEFLM